MADNEKKTGWKHMKKNMQISGALTLAFLAAGIIVYQTGALDRGTPLRTAASVAKNATFPKVSARSKSTDINPIEVARQRAQKRPSIYLSCHFKKADGTSYTLPIAYSALEAFYNCRNVIYEDGKTAKLNDIATLSFQFSISKEGDRVFETGKKIFDITKDDGRKNALKALENGRKHTSDEYKGLYPLRSSPLI